MMPWSCHSRELTSAAGKIKLHTQCDEMQHNETPHLIKNSTKDNISDVADTGRFHCVRKIISSFWNGCLQQKFQKVWDGILFTTRLPHNVLQPDLRATIAKSVKAVRVLCRCRISPDPTVFHWRSLPVVPVYYCQRLMMRVQFINRPNAYWLTDEPGHNALPCPLP